ncbi:MAG: lipid-A-disaccharide synthase [Bacteroidetes bacterium]|nr:lipid-A-disaccharide synthase [Bacteroidota bacterium]HET6245221.1 lipid-A-disaccharide synthase [Bacteroidia bacterium]
MNYYIIAGEASGDLHASNLMKSITRLDGKAKFRCWGGDLMQAQGGVLVKHYRELAFMGFAEVLLNISTILKNLKFCKKDISENKPDVLILVDYPGFNLRIADFAKKKGIKVFYYISPQIWAWKQNRVHKIKRIVDKMFVILPFEEDFYARFNYKVDYVGHPLLDAIEEFNTTKLPFEEFTKKHKLGSKPIVAILPGSRKQEISKMLEIMLSISPFYANYQFVIARAPSIDAEFYSTFIKQGDVKIISNSTYELLQHSTAALVTSGTATLETALFEVPQVVCYSGGIISYTIAKALIKVKYISLVNLVMDEKVVTELIQDDFNAENLKQQLDILLFNEQDKQRLSNKYKELRKKLGNCGASNKTASLMVNNLP